MVASLAASSPDDTLPEEPPEPPLLDEPPLDDPPDEEPPLLEALPPEEPLEGPLPLDPPLEEAPLDEAPPEEPLLEVVLPLETPPLPLDPLPPLETPLLELLARCASAPPSSAPSGSTVDDPPHPVMTSAKLAANQRRRMVSPKSPRLDPKRSVREPGKASPFQPPMRADIVFPPG